eukprot:TRINITY_DN1717_c0_g2_i3.p2 TRINITY_DN1717_c0_g2~~TRINITY_DN1717_c0_g2_i3.p2  ORF type:complete len:333 (+),score=25.60 TRINITY_DN1717_c0_g2_i3:1172-2170(+)
MGLSEFAYCGFSFNQLILFTIYVSLWTGRSLLIRSARTENSDNGTSGYKWHISSIVITTEMLKLVIAYVLFIRNSGTFKKFTSSWRQGVYYALPGLFYVFVNNLYYLVFLKMDAGTFWVLYQLRILISGLLTQIILSKNLGMRKWFALFLLVIGCVVNQIDDALNIRIEKMEAILFLLAQCLFSSLSGVYNEYLFKKDVTMDFNLQNVWLYGFNIVFNIMVVLYSEPQVLIPSNYFVGYDSIVCILIIILTAGGGFATAMILKFLNAIMKEYASSMIMLCSSLGTTYILHEMPLKFETIISIFVVSCSLMIYNYNPVKPKEEKKEEVGSNKV